MIELEVGDTSCPSARVDGSRASELSEVVKGPVLRGSAGALCTCWSCMVLYCGELLPAPAYSSLNPFSAPVEGDADLASRKRMSLVGKWKEQRMLS